jgi:spore coat-associated protein N
MRRAFGAGGRAPLVLRRFALSVALLGLAGTLLVFDRTHAGFTARSSVGAASFSTGIVDLSVAAAGPGNRLTVDASGIVPGDRIERVVDLTNAGTFSLSGVTLTTTAPLSSALDTDAAHGLQMTVDRCSVPWTEAGTPPGYVYTCSGTTSTVLATQPVITTGAALANLSATTPGNTDHLRVVLTFPAAAGDSMQGLSSHLSFTFTGSGS